MHEDLYECLDTLDTIPLGLSNEDHIFILQPQIDLSLKLYV